MNLVFKKNGYYNEKKRYSKYYRMYTFHEKVCTLIKHVNYVRLKTNSVFSLFQLDFNKANPEHTEK